MTRPRLLDLGCGAGGAAMGYHRAGFDVVGVDIRPQPSYPFDFVQADALDFMRGLLATRAIYRNPRGFVAVHASMPCQFASDLRHRTGRAYVDLVTPLRPRLQQAGMPYVMENVPGAPLRHPILLCGSMFGLGAGGRQLRRHRLFECSFPVMTPTCRHRGQPVGVYGTGGGGAMTRGYKGTPDEYREAMGIDWATRAEIAQAIPPAYTEHVGHYLMRELREQNMNRPTPPPTEMPWVREDRCDLCGGPGPLTRVQLEPSSGSWRTRNYRAPRVAYVCANHGDTGGVQGPAPTTPHRTTAPGTTSLHPQTEHLL